MVTSTGVATNPRGLLCDHGNYGMIGLGSATGTPRLDKISSRQHFVTHKYSCTAKTTGYKTLWREETWKRAQFIAPSPADVKIAHSTPKSEASPAKLTGFRLSA
jgi:hypothetical protein